MPVFLGKMTLLQCIHALNGKYLKITEIAGRSNTLMDQLERLLQEADCLESPMHSSLFLNADL